MGENSTQWPRATIEQDKIMREYGFFFYNNDKGWKCSKCYTFTDDVQAAENHKKRHTTLEDFA